MKLIFNITILLCLYILQGIPLGLSRTMDLLLQEKQLSFDEQGIFSSVSWPYSLKIMWAPIVDTVFLEKFGRRKSWLVPVQVVLGLLLIFASYHITSLLGEDVENGHPDVLQLTLLFFVFYFLAATQDIAVDGWAVEMLDKENVSYASTCNAIGQTLGFFIAFTGYLALKMYDLVTIEGFMFFWGVVFIVATLLISVFKKEEPLENRDSITEAYSQMSQILNLPNMKSLLLVLLSTKVTFAAAEGLTLRKLVQSGLKKEHVASLTVLVTVLNIILPGLFGKYTAHKPLLLIHNTYIWRTLIGFMAMYLVWAAPADLAQQDSLPMYFFSVLLFVVVVSSALQCAHFVAIMAFFAQVSDPTIGGTYMTLLNTLANMGSLWPNQVVLFLVERTTLSWIDGFYVISMLSIVYGVVWHFKFGRLWVYLQDLPITSWRVAGGSDPFSKAE